MSACTFFGHRDCPPSVKEKLCTVLIDLIENRSVNLFYVGRNGAFDGIVRSVLRELVQEYPQIHYAVVLEHMPGKQKQEEYEDYSDTVLPEGIEEVPPRFAISRRNKWMLFQSDFVVTYIIRSWGNAAQFAKIAERQKKTVINLAELSLRNPNLIV